MYLSRRTPPTTTTMSTEDYEDGLVIGPREPTLPGAWAPLPDPFSVEIRAKVRYITAKAPQCMDVYVYPDATITLKQHGYGFVYGYHPTCPCIVPTTPGPSLTIKLAGPLWAEVVVIGVDGTETTTAMKDGLQCIDFIVSKGVMGRSFQNMANMY